MLLPVFLFTTEHTRSLLPCMSMAARLPLAEAPQNGRRRPRHAVPLVTPMVT